MVCLDTNFLIDLIKKETRAIEKLNELVRKNENVSTTSINAAELYKGAYNSSKKEKEIEDVNNILEEIAVLPLTKDAAETYGIMSATKEIKSNYPGDLDLLIASIAITSKETLLTKNMKDFEHIKDLRIDTW